MRPVRATLAAVLVVVLATLGLPWVVALVESYLARRWAQAFDALTEAVVADGAGR